MNPAATDSPPATVAKVITVFSGMTASGKSTLGIAWAQKHGIPYYNTDRIRKELAGLKATERRPDEVGAGIYSPEYTEVTYRFMLDRARDDFAHGAEMVVLDGSYSTRRHRDAVRELAQDVGAEAVVIFCTCSDEEVRRRLEQRSGDPEAVSDGRWEIYLHQKETFEFPDASEPGQSIFLDTEQPVATLLADLESHPLLGDILQDQ
jgi:predicted kinase